MAKDKWVGVALDESILEKFKKAEKWREEHKHTEGSYDDKDNVIMVKVLTTDGEVRWIPISQIEVLEGLVLDDESAVAARRMADEAKE